MFSIKYDVLNMVQIKIILDSLKHHLQPTEEWEYTSSYGIFINFTEQWMTRQID